MICKAVKADLYVIYFIYLYKHFCWALSTPRRLTTVSNMNPEEELREGLIVQAGNRSKI